MEDEGDAVDADLVDGVHRLKHAGHPLEALKIKKEKKSVRITFCGLIFLCNIIILPVVC